MCIRDSYSSSHDGIVPIKILPTRQQVNYINTTEYEKIKEEEHVYKGITTTDCKTFLENNQMIPNEILIKSIGLSVQARDFEISALKSNTPVDEIIKLKKGVPVMCLVNLDIERGIANGSLGVIVDFITSIDGFSQIPYVKFSNGVSRAISLHTWQHPDYPSISYSQIPLCLSYSSTIHKLQGSTLDLAEMNLGASVFAEGQIYVGLSRVKTLEGLYLTAFHPNKIRVNEKVQLFYANFPSHLIHKTSSF